MNKTKNVKGTLLVIGNTDQIAPLLTEQGYNVMTVSGIREAVAAVVGGQADAVLLNLAGGQAKLDLADSLMGIPTRPPIVVLDERVDALSVRAAMRLGLTDYLFIDDGQAEIVGRLIAHIQNGREAKQSSDLWRQGQNSREHDLELRIERRLLLIGTEPVQVSGTELLIAEAFISNQPHLVTYDELMRTVFPGIEDKEHAMRLLRPHVGRLRRKIEGVPGSPWRIENVRGQGYLLRRAGYRAAQNQEPTPPPAVANAPQPGIAQ